VPERLHRVRIAVKQLRYASELAGEARRSRSSSRVATLRSLQDLLGLAHDLHALAELLGAIQQRSVRSSRRTARGIGLLIASLDAECRQLHAAFMSRRAALRALCDALDPPRAVPRGSTAA
jgi:CHAD domain-containing protein